MPEVNSSFISVGNTQSASFHCTYNFIFINCGTTLILLNKSNYEFNSRQAPSFEDMLTKGQEPDVILTHERVANHYLVPSIRLDLDIFRRLQKGEFTWAQFGGTHPKPFGHSYYAAAIERLFDSMLINPKASKPHEIPEEPLNRASYYKGQFLDIHTIKLAKGWEIDEMWDAPEVIQQKSDKANSIDTANDYVRVTTRKGFSKVPMLVSTKPNKKLKFTFEGNAIGIFCVADLLQES